MFPSLQLRIPQLSTVQLMPHDFMAFEKVPEM
jgi:hypothetical protein